MTFSDPEACADLSWTGSTAASTLASEHGITVSSRSSAGLVNLQVSLPALTDALPSLGSLPLPGSAAFEIDATRPLPITCSASAGGGLPVGPGQYRGPGGHDDGLGPRTPG